MNKKLKIALWIIFGVLAISYVVCYIVFKEQTLAITNHVIELVNKPLPIIGVSTVILCLFIYKCVISTRFGKKRLQEYKDELYETKRELAEKEKELNAIVKGFQEKLDVIEENVISQKEVLSEGLSLSRNVKIQALVNKLEGEQDGEEIDSNQEEE